MIYGNPPTGGKPIKKYILDTDPRTGQLGYKIGYTDDNEPVFLRSSQIDDILVRFWNTRNSLKTRILEWWITKG